MNIGRLPGDLITIARYRLSFCRPGSTPAARRRRQAGLLLLALLLAGTVPASAEESCPQGRELHEAGDAAGARAAYEECLAAGLEVTDVLLPLSIMNLEDGDLAAAVELAGRAVAAAPEDPEARYWYGRALLRADHRDEAEAQWEQGLQYSVEHRGLLEGLGRLALAEGESAKAYNLFLQLQRQGVDDPWLDRLLAEIAASKGLWEQALGHLQPLLGTEAETLDDLVMATELAILDRRAEEAVSYGRRAVARSPEARTLGGLGEVFFAVEQVDSALVYLRRAVAEPDCPPRFRFNLANALEVAGRFEESGGEFRAYLAEVPDDPVGHFNYGIHLDKGGRPDEALAELEKAIELDPDMLTAHVVHVQILEALGRWDEALLAVEELRERDPGNAAELRTWKERLVSLHESSLAAAAEGKIHLRYMVVADEQTLARAQAELAQGVDFADVTMRYSGGPAAARGGDIGWIVPGDMVEDLREVISSLAVNEISPPVESGGLFHIFKRIP